MANNPSENLNWWVDIYKTNPDAIIDDLKLKSKQILASKIMVIFDELKTQNKDTRQDKLEALKLKLNPQEKTEIKNTLQANWRWIEQVLEQPTNTLVVNQVSQQVANNPKEPKKDFSFDSILLFFDKFANAWEIYEKVSKAKWDSFWWMLAWIGAFLAYLFKWKLPEIEWVDWSFWPKPQKKPEENKPWGSLEKINENTKYRALSSIFTSIYSKDNKNNIVNILNTQKVEEIKIKDIPNILTKNDLKKELWLEQTSYTNIEIKETLEMFTIWWKNFLDNYYKDWYQEKSIKELILWIKDLHTIEEINNTIIKTDITDIAKIWTIAWNSLNLTDENWSLKQRANDLWINQDIISSLLYHDWDLKLLKENETNLNIEQANIKNKDKVKDIIHFWYSFIEQLKSNKQLNLGFEGITNNIIIPPKDILKLYILTWWKKDFNFNELNDFQKTFTYISILWILDKKNDKLQWQYFTRLAWISYTNWEKKATEFENLVPEWVKKIIWSSINIWKETLESKIKELGFEIYGTLEEKPEILLWIMWVIAIFWWNNKTIPIIAIPKWLIWKILQKSK